MPYLAILPIINEKVSLKPSLPWRLGSDLVLKQLSEADKRLITEYSSTDMQRFDIGNDAFYIDIPDINLKGEFKKDKELIEEETRLGALCLQTVFNIVGHKETMAIPYGVIVNVDMRPIVNDFYDFDFGGDYLSIKPKEYLVMKSVNKEEIKGLIEISRQLIKTDIQLRVAMRRYCSALLKSNREDRLIDLTISLESLLPGKTELAFRFAFYLSLIIDSELANRREVFIQLNDLYSARSCLVHGSSEKSELKNIEKCLENWPNLVCFAKQCILYRLNFQQHYPDDPWTSHLLDLAFGKKPIM